MSMSNKKELELQNCRRKLNEAERRLQEAELAPDKRKMNVLEEQLVQAKQTEQILEDKLKQATQEIMEGTEMIEKFSISRTPQAELVMLNKKFDILQAEHTILTQDNEILDRRLSETENDLRECEEKLTNEIERCSNLDLGRKFLNKYFPNFSSIMINILNFDFACILGWKYLPTFWCHKLSNSIFFCL